MITINDFKSIKVTFYAKEDIWFYNYRNEYIQMLEGDKKSMSLSFFHTLPSSVKRKLCIKSKKSEQIMREYFKCVKLNLKNGSPLR